MAEILRIRRQTPINQSIKLCPQQEKSELVYPYFVLQRLDRINRLVFDKSHLQKLRDSICSLFDVFQEILQNDFEYGCHFDCDDIIARLNEVVRCYIFQGRTSRTLSVLVFEKTRSRNFHT